MPIESPDDLTEWVERRLLDRHGAVVGIVVDIYDDVATGRPKWFAVSTGFFGLRRVVAPASGASRLGEDVMVRHDKHVIDTAPRVRPMVTLRRNDEQALVEHYASTPPAQPRRTHD
ncbi:MAG: PRC-barrel domain-containing protein [Acidimicrobiia bacterium]|nr:PRC-barrel domain-containing protein [Acidimicrobiia bacterium]